MSVVAEKKEAAFGIDQGRRKLHIAGRSNKDEKKCKKEIEIEKKVASFKGSFSREVTESYRWKEYVGDGRYVGGYIGNSSRSPRRDKILEKILREQGLGAEGIACWLSSTQGRHMMNDDVDTIKAFEKRARKYTKGAFWSVTIWSHPDNIGSLASRCDIENKIIAAAKAELQEETKWRSCFEKRLSGKRLSKKRVKRIR